MHHFNLLALLSSDLHLGPRCCFSSNNNRRGNAASSTMQLCQRCQGAACFRVCVTFASSLFLSCPRLLIVPKTRRTLWKTKSPPFGSPKAGSVKNSINPSCSYALLQRNLPCGHTTRFFRDLQHEGWMLNRPRRICQVRFNPKKV